jgi:hypothetical protein
MSLVRVWTDVGQKNPKALLAKITSSSEGPVYTIRYLTADDEEDDRGRIVYRYEPDTFEVEEEMIAEWLDLDDETDIGFTRVGEGTWVKGDDDSDYVPDEDEENDDQE